MSAVTELRRHSHGPEVIAKQDGRCRSCKRLIRAKRHYVVVVDGLGTMHALCGKSYCRTLNDLLDEHSDDYPEGEAA